MFFFAHAQRERLSGIRGVNLPIGTSRNLLRILRMDADSIQPGNASSLASTLDLARQFAGEVSGVPVEIVEASDQTAVLGEAAHDGGQTVVEQGETLEIMDVTGATEELASSLTVAMAPVSSSAGMTSGMSQVGPLTSSTDVVQLASEGLATATPSVPGISSATGQAECVQRTVTSLPSHEAITNTTELAAGLGVSLDSANLEQQLQQVSQTALQTFQEVSRSLRSEGIEISPEAIVGNFQQTLADSLAASMVPHPTGQACSAASVLESAITQSAQGLPMGISISYGDLSDVSRVISSSVDPSLTVSPSMRGATRISMAPNTMESVLNESEIMPSSPESNFDTSELLNTIAQRDEVMSKLASAGPVGKALGYLPASLMVSVV